MLETPFQSNGLLSGTEMEKSDEPMTAREELEMMSNGILDGSMEDAEVMRTLSASGETGAADVNGKKMTKDGEARNAPSRDVQEEFSGNGLLFGHPCNHSRRIRIHYHRVPRKRNPRWGSADDG